MRSGDGREGQAERSRAGHPAHAHSENAGPRADARVRHWHAPGADQPGRLPGERRIALPRAAPARARRPDRRRLARHGEQPPREILFAHFLRPRQAQARDPRLGDAGRCHHSNSRGVVGEAVMAIVTRIARGIRALLGKARVERELDAELRDYLDAAIEDKMRGGLSREDATRATGAQIGSLEAVKDRVRDAGWESLVESVWQDVRYGGRMLRRSPGFAVIAIGILALGIGANTAIFSVLNAVMWRTLPVQAPEELVEPLSKHPSDPRMNAFSWEFYEHVRDRNHVFTDVIGVSPTRFQVSRDGAEVEAVDGEYVVGTLFSTLGLQPAIGRLIDPQDARPSAAPVAVVSWSYWQSRFNLNPAILGTQIKVNGAPATIVGVAPRAFIGLQTGMMPAIWLPATRPMN